jgi:sec-independent protein translocase protein TatA
MLGFSSPLEIAVVGGVLVLLFGTKKLPELGAGLGKAISNFRNSYKEAGALDVTPTEAKKNTENNSANETKSGE